MSSKRTQLVALLENMKQQGKESATFNIDFLLEAVQQEPVAVRTEKREDTGMYNRPQTGDMDGGSF